MAEPLSGILQRAERNLSSSSDKNVPERQQMAATAWADFCDSLKAAGQQLLRTDFPIDELDLAEGLRYLSRLTFTSLDRNVEGANPAKPLLYPLCNTRIKVGGDNPDNHYFAAAVSAPYRYVLRGDFRACSYFSVVTTGKVDGSQNVISGSLNSSAATQGEDGFTEIHIGPENAGGNMLLVDERTSLLIVRCTIETPGGRAPQLELQRVDRTPDDTVLSVESVAQGLQGATDFVRNASAYYADWTARFQSHKNTLPIYPDQDYLVSIGGDPNIRYYLSAWELNADEALLIHIPVIPDCTTWNCQLCNVWFESLDYCAAQIHVNSRSAVPESDGSVLIVVSATDPDHPNWLRTLGHGQGTVCLRLVGSREPLLANTRVVVARELQQSTGRVSSTM